MGSRCKRCVTDSINGYSHKECYTCLLKQQGIKICVVCFQSINNTSQICIDCKEYKPTMDITRHKLFKH